MEKSQQRIFRAISEFAFNKLSELSESHLGNRLHLHPIQKTNRVSCDCAGFIHKGNCRIFRLAESFQQSRNERLLSAVNNHPAPEIAHSDQGSEYASKDYVALENNLGINPSMSQKGCPWENGYQESFYSQFKVDLGDPNRFNHLGELVWAIYKTIHNYNNTRIQTSLKMPPAEFAKKHYERSSLSV